MVQQGVWSGVIRGVYYQIVDHHLYTIICLCICNGTVHVRNVLSMCAELLGQQIGKDKVKVQLLYMHGDTAGLASNRKRQS